MFGSDEIARLSGWSTDGLRDLRRRGSLDEIGMPGADGDWRYSRRDAAAMWLAGIFHERDRGADLRHVFRQAETLADALLAHLDGRPAKRFAVSTHVRHADDEGIGRLTGWSVAWHDSLDAIDMPGLVAIEAIDLRSLARLAPEPLRRAPA